MPYDPMADRGLTQELIDVVTAPFSVFLGFGDPEVNRAEREAKKDAADQIGDDR